MEDGYKYIRDYLDDVTPDSIKFKTMKFLDYLRKQWIVRPDIDSVSVDGRHIAATSGLESINRKVNTLVGDAHPISGNSSVSASQSTCNRKTNFMIQVEPNFALFLLQISSKL